MPKKQKTPQRLDTRPRPRPAVVSAKLGALEATLRGIGGAYALRQARDPLQTVGGTYHWITAMLDMHNAFAGAGAHGVVYGATTGDFETSVYTLADEDHLPDVRDERASVMVHAEFTDDADAVVSVRYTIRVRPSGLRMRTVDLDVEGSRLGQHDFTRSYEIKPLHAYTLPRFALGDVTSATTRNFVHSVTNRVGAAARPRPFTIVDDPNDREPASNFDAPFIDEITCAL